ncbi:MalY/PatB family protein [Egicoccus sp. AB-alg2]|uniref:MalY/PatB family protein n=1 Tax=Egicoccus sp. AB-alg2 TaxID=3242693 RepID=UPI00359CECB7
MDPLESFTLEELRQRRSVKWRTYPPDVLPLWVAEMDAALAEPVARVLSDAVARSDTGYPAGDGYQHAMADFARRRWGWDVPVTRMALMPDVMRGAMELVRLVTAPGAPVIVNPPVYPPFYAYLRHAERTVVEVPLDVDGRLDLRAVDDAMAELAGRSAAYLLCNPQNPTGTVHRREELAAVAASASRHGVRVVVDEIHAPLVLSGADFVPYLTVPGSEDAFSLLSASKGWNLPGLKAAVAVAGPAAAAQLASLPVEVAHGATHFGVLSHTAALRDGEDWLDAVVASVTERRARLGDLLARHLPDVRWRPGEATYLAWLDCRGLGLDRDPADHFLAAGVAVVDGRDFGTGGEGHVRLNFATSTSILEEAVHRMAASL